MTTTWDGDAHHPGLNAVRLLREQRVLIAWIAVAAFYAFSASGALLPASSEWRLAIDRAFNRDGIYGNPEGLLEWFEAVAWAGALLAYVLALVRSAHAERWKVDRWGLFFVALAFVALGEELSWGQHLFQWRAPELMQAVNLQHETNVHNLHLSRCLGVHGVAAAAVLDAAMGKLGQIFIAVCFAVWFVLPLAKNAGLARSWRLVQSVPVPRRGTRALFAASLLVFVIVDRLVIDVGEVLEAAVSIVAWLTGVDVLETRPARSAVPVGAAVLEKAPVA